MRLLIFLVGAGLLAGLAVTLRAGAHSPSPKFSEAIQHDVSCDSKGCWVVHTRDICIVWTMGVCTDWQRSPLGVR